MHEPTPDWRDEHNAEARWQGMHTAARQGEAISWAEVLQVEADYKRWRAANLFGALGSDRGTVDETTPQDQKPTTLV